MMPVHLSPFLQLLQARHFTVSFHPSVCESQPPLLLLDPPPLSASACVPPSLSPHFHNICPPPPEGAGSALHPTASKRLAALPRELTWSPLFVLKVLLGLRTVLEKKKNWTPLRPPLPSLRFCSPASKLEPRSGLPTPWPMYFYLPETNQSPPFHEAPPIIQSRMYSDGSPPPHLF